jgi:hypothetical protein
MHEHDPDLVAALAEGSLSPADARTAETEIVACPRCAADLSSQRTAIEALRSLPGLHLAETERTNLRAAVADAINLDLEADPAPRARQRQRRSIPWPSVAVAALSVLAVVAIVPLVGTLTTSGSGDDAASVELALTTTVTETKTAPAEEAPRAAEEALPADGSSLTQEATAPPLEAAADSSAEAGGAPVERVGETDLRALLDEPADLLASAEDLPGPCDEVVAREFFEDLDAVLVTPVPELGAIAYLVTADGASIDRIVVLDPDTCEALASFG